MEGTGSMQAIVMDEPGGPEVLSLRSVPRPIPEVGEIRVRVATSGVNRADLLQRMGRYPVPEGWPEDILGLEFSGVVDALGPEVERWREGDRVMGILGGGGYAQYVTTHGTSVVPVPDSVGLEERVLPFFRSGKARPVIDRIFSPEEAADAHRVMEANANFGKLLIRWE